MDEYFKLRDGPHPTPAVTYPTETRPSETVLEDFQE